MRRLAQMLSLSALFAFLSAFIWLLWAQDEYRGQTGCPFDIPHHGHPELVGLALALGSMIIATGIWWTQGKRGEAVAVGLVTGLAAVILLWLTSVFVGAGLHCFD